MLNPRHRQIIEFLTHAEFATVETLASRFKVTLQTIRRDLRELAEAGHIERTHGGAALASGTHNIEYEQRRTLNREAKAAIARACAAEVTDDMSVFINIGTTTEAVARELLDRKNLLVVTNNINVAKILEANPGCEIVVTGGTLRRADGGLIGPVATRVIEQFKFDLAIVGCSALDADGDLLDFDIQEVGVSQTILQQSRRTVAVADQSKLSRFAPVKIASLEHLDALYTDADIPRALQARLTQWNTRLMAVTL